MNISVVGTAHAAIHNAKNLGALLLEMVRNSILLETTDQCGSSSDDSHFVSRLGVYYSDDDYDFLVGLFGENKNIKKLNRN